MNARFPISDWFFLLAIGTLIGFGIGFVTFKHNDDNPHAQIGHDTAIVAVIIHDTVTAKKKAGDIASSRKLIYDTIPFMDTVRSDTLFSIKKDTTQCFSIEETEEDGAFIHAQICSDSFPLVKPEDITGEITYVAAPDTSRRIMRTDTITASPKGLFLKCLSWLGVGIVSGIAVIALFGGDK